MGESKPIDPLAPAPKSDPGLSGERPAERATRPVRVESGTVSTVRDDGMPPSSRNPLRSPGTKVGSVPKMPAIRRVSSGTMKAVRPEVARPTQPETPAAKVPSPPTVPTPPKVEHEVESTHERIHARDEDVAAGNASAKEFPSSFPSSGRMLDFSPTYPELSKSSQTPAVSMLLMESRAPIIPPPSLPTPTSETPRSESSPNHEDGQDGHAGAHHEPAHPEPTEQRRVVASPERSLADPPEVPVELPMQRRSGLVIVSAVTLAVIVIGGGMTAAKIGFDAGETRASVVVTAPPPPDTRIVVPTTPVPVDPVASAAVEPEAAPTTPTPAPAGPAPTTGMLNTAGSHPGRRIFVDKRFVGQTPASIKLACGKHVVKIGSSGREQAIDVPCGGELPFGD